MATLVLKVKDIIKSESKEEPKEVEKEVSRKINGIDLWIIDDY